MTRPVKILLTCATVIVIMAVAWVYFTLDPATTPIFPHCMVLDLTGFKCPGCGSQRAIHALMHGHILAAWHYNAMLLISLPFIGLLIYAQLIRKKSSRLYARLNSSLSITIILAVILAWSFARNIFGW